MKKSGIRRLQTTCLGLALALSFGLSADKNEERELLFRHLHSSFKEAERCMAEDRYEEASEILENLIDQGRAIGFDQRTYMELSMRLAETYAAREMPAESEALLTELIAIHPPDDLYLRMELLRSHILADMGSVGAAYTNLLALDEKIPNLEWSVDDRRFFHQMTEALDQQWEDLILRADRLFSAALYDESIQIFSEVVKGINNGAYPKAKPFTDKGREILAKVRHRLAEAYYCVGKFEGTATVLSNIQPRYYQGSSELQQLYVSDLYLLGSAARQAGDFQTAEESLKAYLAYGKNFELPHQDEALLELGLNYVKSSKPHLAQQTFEDLSKRAVQPYYKGLAHSYAARIYIDAGNYEAADEALGEAEKLVDSDEPLSLEIHYLRGEALYHMGRWQEAISAYQAALPPVHPERVAWREATLYNIAWANLELGDASGRGSAEQLAYYDRAENVLNSLVGDGADEEVYLSLAKGYLKRAEKLGDDACLGKIDKLLAKEGLFKSMDHALEACLLRAEASRDPDQKETLLAQATDPRFSNAERYGEAWLLRGMNRFEQAKDLHSLQIKDRADAHYQKASDAFSTAFEILRTKNRVLAGQALRHEVQSYFQQGSYENRYMALSLIESLLDSHRDVYTAMREQDELLYYRGLIASYLMPYGEAEELKQLAMESLNRVVEQWPEGSYAADAYNVMGSVHVLSGDYASAEQVYLTLARDYPYSEHVGEAWFWAAEAASALHRDGAIVRKYRRKVFDEHPQTAHAAEAYFKYYNYSDYLQGQGQAMAHLQGMKSLFPNSPHLIVADYLIGLDLKGERRSETGDIVHYADMGAALGAFEEARQHFDFCYEHGLMDSRSLECLVNVRYRAMLERAGGLAQTAELAEGAKRAIYFQYAEQAYREIVQDFGDDATPIVAFLQEEIPAQGVREEAEYGLANVCVETGRVAEAEEVLNGMLNRFTAEGISSGSYPAKVWAMKGRLAEQRRDFETAIACLESAENAGAADAVGTDQLLDLLIRRAGCLRAKGDLDAAMALLSRVVDEQVVSSERIRAMYLRAEVYEAQGRHDLALKQLEATADKGGEWAYKAKEKIQNDFRIH